MTAKRLDVQGLRAVAVVLVVAFHAGVGVPGGFTGVDVFFVISGFVITGTLLRELERDGRISLPRFYARRVKRLLPALAAMLVFVAAAGVLLDPVTATHVSGLTGVFASFFTANWYLWQLPTGYFDVSTQLDPLLHTWTLAVEEQFYLVFPVVLLAGWRLRGRLAAAASIAALAAGSLVVALAASGSFGYYGSPARAWEFAAGCLISLAAPAFARLPDIAGSALGAAGCVAIALTAVATLQDESILVTAVVPVIAAVCLIVAGFAPGNMISSCLATSPFVTVGNVSYSLYLWHWPLIVFARALAPGDVWAPPAAAVAAIVPAWLSYRYLENPIRSNPRIVGRRVIALAAACIAVPMLASVALMHLQLVSSADAAAFHADLTRGCDGPQPYGSPTRTHRCDWTMPGSHGAVVLIGDSNAGHFTEPVVRAGAEEGYDVDVVTFSACPFVALDVPQAGPTCRRFNTESLNALAQARPALVIIASRSDTWINDRKLQLARIGGADASGLAAVKERLWAVGLRDEIAVLNHAGVPVVVVHPVPVVPVAATGCAVVLILSDRCTGSVSRVDVDRELRRTLNAETVAVTGRDAAVLNLEPRLCGAAKCSTEQDGIAMYRDSHHLSIAGSLTLAPVFASVIRRLARRS